MSYDSYDWVDEATEILQRSKFPWVLVIGYGPDVGRVESNISLSQDVEENVIAAVKDHFETNRK